MGHAAVASLIAAIALWAPWSSQKPRELPIMRLDVDLGSNLRLPRESEGLLSSLLRSTLDAIRHQAVV